MCKVLAKVAEAAQKKEEAGEKEEEEKAKIPFPRLERLLPGPHLQDEEQQQLQQDGRLPQFLLPLQQLQ